MLSLPPALAALGRWRQFVCWFAIPSETQPGKLDKLPVAWSDIGDKKAGDVVSAHDPQFWTDAETAAAHAPRFDRGHGCGVGFVLTEADPFFFLDIDGALQPDRTWSVLALDLCKTFAGAAVEVSVSGTGLHILGAFQGDLVHAKKNIPLHLELYTSKRFIALTGSQAVGDVWTDHTVALQSVVAGLFQPKVADFEGWTTEPVAEWAGPTDDDALIARAMRSQPRQSADAAFGGGPQVPSFAQLWNADADALGAYWPHSTQAYDASSADQALANHLAFFTGKDCGRVERLMRRSALLRQKWEDRPEYLADTIVNACGFLRTVLNEPSAPVMALPKTLTAAARMTLRGSSEYMSPEGQAEHFDGCVYVGSLNVVYDGKSGRLLNKAAFDVMRGGYLFVIDPMGKKTTDSAWSAFTQSRVLQCPSADDVCFRPEVESGSLVTVGNHVLVNTYFPFTPDMEEGDISLFLDLMERILPEAGDRDILMHYMASLVQNPGHKFQWWPVIQGAEGNGKTLLLSALTYAVGEHFTHLPNAAAMARDGLKFNSWIHRKLFIGVEEIYTSERRSFLEEFKTVVTNERSGMEPKGQEQVTRDNRANGVLITNHMDGVPITADTRRYAILYTRQQKAEDIIRDGMGGEYFPELWSWFKSGGNRRVAYHLRHMPLRAELDPAQLCVRAPKTSSYVAALHASRGRAELEVLEAIDQGRPGFCGGFVSSIWLDDLLDRIRANIPRTKRDAMLASLGFIPHPGLPDARTARPVKPDGRKTRLFVRDGHVSLNTTDPETLATAYERAQAAVAAEVAFGPGPVSVKS